MGLIKEFKQFAMRGNMIDLAIGVVIGGAFGKIVSSLVSDIIMPPIGLLIGGVNFSELVLTLKAAGINAAGEAVPAVTLNIGLFIQAIFDFIIIAFAIFIIIKGMNRLAHLNNQEEEAKPTPPPVPTKEEELLTEIRDLLKEKSKS